MRVERNVAVLVVISAAFTAICALARHARVGDKLGMAEMYNCVQLT